MFKYPYLWGQAKLGYNRLMDPNQSLQTNPVNPQQPQNLKEKITETSNEFVKDHYEGFLHRLVNFTYSVLKFIKNNLIIMIKMAIGKE